MAYNLLGLLLAEHCLRRCQQSTNCNLAELLLFKELSDIHSCAQLFVALTDRTNESTSFAGEHLPEGGASDPISGPELGLNLEVETLRVHLGFKLGSEVEYVLDDIHLSFKFLVNIDRDVNARIACKSDSSSIGNKVPDRVVSSLNMKSIKSKTY